MKNSALLLIILLIALTVNSRAQEITVTQFEFAEAIENRSPIGPDTVFVNDIGTVYCFTRVEGVYDTTQIVHEWYYKNNEKARIKLTVASNDWRTWSSKKIVKNWTGPWRVMVLGPDNNVLATKNFIVRKNQ